MSLLTTAGEYRNYSRVYKQGTPQWFMGLDPGASGGLALVNLDGNVTRAVVMPPTERDLLEWVRSVVNVNRSVMACVEQVSGHVGKEQPGSAMFNFGCNYGMLRMALTACDVKYDLVNPRRWQKVCSISPRESSETRTQWKNRMKARAQQLFPGTKVTLAVADALLIAEYCRLVYGVGWSPK